MFRFEHIEYSLALLAIPVAVLLFILTRMWRKRALQRFGDLPLMRQLMPDVSKGKPVLKFILVASALLFLVLGIMNPQFGSKMEDVKREGADIMIALDVSRSMMAEDLSPNRLAKAKQAIEKLIDKLQGDRVGIIIFAGQAYVQLPITSDYSAAQLFLRSIDTDIITAQGTEIAQAITLAARSFGAKETGRNKAIIIITDGETHDENAIQAAKEAEDKGIIIHTIGMGSVTGAPIPIYRGSVQTGYHKDESGTTVITKLNEEMLMELAEAGDGIYVRASNAEAGLNIVLEEIEKLEKQQFESKRYVDYDDRFQPVIAIALALLVLESLLSERKSKWIENLDIFGERKKR